MTKQDIDSAIQEDRALRAPLTMTIINAVVWMSIWVSACAIADYIIPGWIGRCWIMLFGVATYEVQKACTSVTRITGQASADDRY